MNQVTLKTIALSGTALILVVLVAMGLLNQCASAITDGNRPVQVQLHYPTPYPTAAPVGLAENYDSIARSTDRQHQRQDGETTGEATAFAETDYIGHGAVGPVDNVILLPVCIPAPGFPWTQHLIGAPGDQPMPSQILSGGSGIRSAFVLQEYGTLAGGDDTGINTVLVVVGGAADHQPQQPPAHRYEVAATR